MLLWILNVQNTGESQESFLTFKSYFKPYKCITL